MTYLARLTNLDDMDEVVNMHDAKTHLSRLVARAEAGEEIVIARDGKPAARLVAFGPTAPKLGTMRDRWPRLADDFFAPLSDEELETWGT